MGTVMGTIRSIVPKDSELIRTLSALIRKDQRRSEKLKKREKSDSKSGALKSVRVQVPPSALERTPVKSTFTGDLTTQNQGFDPNFDPNWRHNDAKYSFYFMMHGPLYCFDIRDGKLYSLRLIQ